MLFSSNNFRCYDLICYFFKLKQEFYFKFYQNYIPFNIFPDVDYCSFAVNSNQLSYFSSIVNVLKQKVPGFVHPCPYVGKDFQIRNLTVVTSDLALWITGEYKLVYTVYDDKDPKIYQVSARGVIGKRTWIHTYYILRCIVVSIKAIYLFKLYRTFLLIE